MGLRIFDDDRPGFAILDFQRDIGPDTLAITLRSKLLKFGEYLGNDGKWSPAPWYFKAVRVRDKGPGAYRAGPEIASQGSLAFDLIEISVHGTGIVEEVMWPELSAGPDTTIVEAATDVPPEPAAVPQVTPAKDPVPESSHAAEPTTENERPRTAEKAEKPAGGGLQTRWDRSLPDLEPVPGIEPLNEREPLHLRKQSEGKAKPEPVMVLGLLPEAPLEDRNPARYRLMAAAVFAITVLAFGALVASRLFCVPFPFLGGDCKSSGNSEAANSCAKGENASNGCAIVPAKRSAYDVRRDREAAAQVRTCIASKALPPCGADSCIVTYLNDFPAGDYRSELIELDIQTNERCRLAERDTARRSAEDEDRVRREQEAEEQAQREASERQRAQAVAREKARFAAEEAEAAAREKAMREAEERQRAQALAEEREKAEAAAGEQARREAEERELAEAAARKREAEERGKAEAAAREQAKREAEEAAARDQAKRQAEEREKAEAAARDRALRDAEDRMPAQETRAGIQSGQPAGVFAVPDGDYSGRTSREDSCSPAAASVIVTIKEGKVCWEHDLNFANRWSGTIAPSGTIEARVFGRPGTGASGQVVNGGTMSIEMTYPECTSRIRIKLLGMIGAASACPQ